MNAVNNQGGIHMNVKKKGVAFWLCLSLMLISYHIHVSIVNDECFDIHGMVKESVLVQQLVSGIQH